MAYGKRRLQESSRKREASRGLPLQEVSAVTSWPQPHRGILGHSTRHTSKLSLSGGKEPGPGIHQSLPRTAGGWMLAPCVHRVLRAIESLQGKWQSWHSEAVRELCREMAHPEGHGRDSQPLAQMRTASCHLKDETLEVSVWAEGQRAVQRLLGICPNSYLHIDRVTLDGATSGSFPLLASRESSWLSEVPYT